MMRCLSMDQKRIYQQYSLVGKKLIKIFSNSQEKEITNRIVWEIVTKKGIWKLPIPREYGGTGLNWHDCVIALDGIFSRYADTNMLSVFLSQVSSLYIILRYGTEQIKKKYLPKLINGEKTRFIISKHIHHLLTDSHYPEDKIFKLNNFDMIIHAEKNHNDIIFTIKKRISSKQFTNSNQTKTDDENRFIVNGIGISAIYDLINFEKLFYGILSSRFMERVNLKMSRF